MLGLFLLILKVIGIILLIIVVLIIILLLLVLFAPIRYKCKMSKYDRICADIEISWIFKLFRFYFKLNNNSQSRIVFIPFEIINNIKKNKTHRVVKKKTKTKDTEKEKTNKNVSKKNTKREKIGLDAHKENIEQEKVNTRNNKKSIKKENVSNEVEEKKERDIKTETDQNQKEEKHINQEDTDDVSVISNIKKIMSYKDKNEIILLTVKLSKKLFNVLIPNKFKLSTVIGLGNPYDTGCFVAFINSIKIFIPLDIEINGDFEKSDFNFYLNISGKANIFKVSLPIVMYILKKPIWNIITGKGREISDE